MENAKFYYYYLRDADGHPRVTVALVKHGKYIFRGVSICSFKETPNKKYGKRQALHRIAKLLIVAKYLPVNALFPIKRARAQAVLCVCGEFEFAWKAEINPELTDFEKEILYEVV